MSGMSLADICGSGVRNFGLIGVALAVAYSLPRVQPVSREFGETAITRCAAEFERDEDEQASGLSR